MLVLAVFQLFYCNCTPYKTDTSPRRTTDTLNPSTDSCEVHGVFLVNNASKRKWRNQNEATLLLHNQIRKGIRQPTPLEGF